MTGPGRPRQFCGMVHGSYERALGFDKPIPEGFFEDTALRSALACHDFGVVFKAIRSHTGLSQLQLGTLVGLSQAHVSDVERGQRRITHIRVVARLATALGIPGSLLGFSTDSDAHNPGRVAVEEVSWVERRDFLALVAAAALGSGVHPELARLDSLLPAQLEPASRPRIGAADVDAIETLTAAMRQAEFAHGGGLLANTAVAQLHQVRRLEDAICTPQVHTRLLVASADLASRAAWMAYDVEDHDSARKLWTYALATARRADQDPRAIDLSVTALLDVAHQSLHLNRPREAQSLVRLASATAASNRHPPSTVLQGYISAVGAWCHAAQGDTDATRRAVGQAEDVYASSSPGMAPPWVSFAISDAELTAQEGYASYLLSLTQPEFAADAVEKLTAATASYGGAYERSRAVNLPPLAVTQIQAGDLAAGIATGHEAIRAITGLSATRGYARLRILDSVARRHDGKPEVAELREHIRAALTPAA